MKSKMMIVMAMITIVTGQKAISATNEPTTKYAVTRDCPECLSISFVDTHGSPIRPFYMATFETSWREYMAAVDEVSCPAPTNRDGHPIPNVKDIRDGYAVSGVTYGGALCFINWLSRKTHQRYRLPTHEEWMFAAKHATVSSPSTDGSTSNHNTPEQRDAVKGGVARPALHGAPTPDGIYGLLDGVGEMTNSLRPASTAVCTAYGGKVCSQVEVLGLSLAGNAHAAKESSFIMITYPNSYVGFRVVRDHN